MPAPIRRPEKKPKGFRIQPPELPAALEPGELEPLLLQADADDEPLAGRLLKRRGFLQNRDPLLPVRPLPPVRAAGPLLHPGHGF